MLKVETEKKYYCIEPEKLEKIAQDMGFDLLSKSSESDEYFTDINNEYIKNRTCLRIRKVNNKSMEITYKGKSTSFLSQYCKLENNITADIKEYDNYVSFFSSLGFYSYVIVEKERITYSLKRDDYSYSIMLDKLKDIGGFVEFEIVVDQEKSNLDVLNSELNSFVSSFNEVSLKEENKPYRDIVAEYVFDKNVSSKNNTDLYINIDNELMHYEKDFFKKYKDIISKKCNRNIKWAEYKRNNQLGEEFVTLIDNYLDNLIFDNNSLYVTINLLKRINMNIHFITEINEVFYSHLFGKLCIELNDITYLNSETFVKYVKRMGISNKLIINKQNLNEVNSILLILINYINAN